MSNNHMTPEQLRERIEKTRILNADLVPYTDTDYYCGTCGSRSGECHPETGYCFVCDSDDWEPVDSRVGR